MIFRFIQWFKFEQIVIGCEEIRCKLISFRIKYILFWKASLLSENAQKKFTNSSISE